MVATFKQFRSKAKTRHDFSDQIQVRYVHPNGEKFDTWISGEEVLLRLDTQARERLIKSFGQKNWREMREETGHAISKGKEKTIRSLKDRLAGAVSDTLGDNIIGDTLADNIRGVDSDVDAHDHEKRQWQSHLQDEAFRAIALELAWINLEGTFPDEVEEETDDWV
jgi:hypothetical protein